MENAGAGEERVKERRSERVKRTSFLLRECMSSCSESESICAAMRLCSSARKLSLSDLRRAPLAPSLSSPSLRWL